MLVLTRKKNETIHIGGNVVIKVIATGRGKVKIGIEAPTVVRVRRGELSLEGHAPSDSNPQQDMLTHEVAFA